MYLSTQQHWWNIHSHIQILAWLLIYTGESWCLGSDFLTVRIRSLEDLASCRLLSSFAWIGAPRFALCQRWRPSMLPLQLSRCFLQTAWVWVWVCLSLFCVSGNYLQVATLEDWELQTTSCTTSWVRQLHPACSSLSLALSSLVTRF